MTISSVVTRHCEPHPINAQGWRPHAGWLTAPARTAWIKPGTRRAASSSPDDTPIVCRWR